MKMTQVLEQLLIEREIIVVLCGGHGQVVGQSLYVIIQCWSVLMTCMAWCSWPWKSYEMKCRMFVCSSYSQTNNDVLFTVKGSVGCSFDVVSRLGLSVLSWWLSKRRYKATSGRWSNFGEWWELHQILCGAYSGHPSLPDLVRAHFESFMNPGLRALCARTPSFLIIHQCYSGI